MSWGEMEGERFASIQWTESHLAPTLFPRDRSICSCGNCTVQSNSLHRPIAIHDVITSLLIPLPLPPHTHLVHWS